MKYFYILIIIILSLWIIYDIGKLIYRKLFWKQIKGELVGYTYVPKQNNDDQSSYTLRIKYNYNGKNNIYETKYSISMFVPKHGSEQKIYINKKNNKVYFIHYPTFIFFLFFRFIFLIVFVINF